MMSSISHRPRRSATRPAVVLFRPEYERTKRALDLGLALLILPPVLAVMGVCAMLIWVTDGRPILFAQKRTGRGGRLEGC